LLKPQLYFFSTSLLLLFSSLHIILKTITIYSSIIIYNNIIIITHLSPVSLLGYVLRHQGYPLGFMPLLAFAFQVAASWLYLSF